jgi:hypothetical protein
MIAKGFTPENGAKVFAIKKIATWSGAHSLTRGIKPHSQARHTAKPPCFGMST